MTDLERELVLKAARGTALALAAAGWNPQADEIMALATRVEQERAAAETSQWK